MSSLLQLNEPQADDPFREETLLLHEFLRECDSTQKWREGVLVTQSGKKITSQNQVFRAQIALVALRLLQEGLLNKVPYEEKMIALECLICNLHKKKLPYTEEAIIRLSEFFRDEQSKYWDNIAAGTLVRRIDEYLKKHEASAALNTEIEQLSKKFKSKIDIDVFRKAAVALNKIIGQAPPITIKSGEAWSDQALADLEIIPEQKKKQWSFLITHAQTATVGKPSEKWLKEAQPLLDAVTFEEFRTRMLTWLPLVDKPRTTPRESLTQWEPDYNLLIIEPHADILKGFAWLAGMQENAELARALANLAISSYKKVPSIGPRLIKVGNACVYSLGAMPGEASLAQLAFLKVKVKFGTAQKGIEKALNTTAERVGLSVEELEEISVPEYGLTSMGERLEPMGEFSARLRLIENGKTDLKWIKADGKEQKSIPAALKQDFKDEIKELKSVAKDITRMHSAQRDRLDGLFLKQKQWKFIEWQERYLDHPLIGTLARRLIWEVTTENETRGAIWNNDQLVDAANQVIATNSESTVKIWHPIGHSIDEITAWRDWLEQHTVRQPFKQAHREVYLLTDAEINTGTYSNRFAAHIIKQHQFNALCGQRGWKNSLRLMVDDGYAPPSIQLAGWNLRAEFWVEGAGDEYGVDSNETGTFLYLMTDQVRFYPVNSEEHYVHAMGGGYAPGSTEPLPLEEIPPLVFSEVLRDVDLFVGVASVGNDPNWSDGGPEGRYVDYWQSYSFGELSATAQTRKEVLEKLIPRLKIANACTLSDRFLIVQGAFRTYKIHLGSGNILMEPNDQYLCIVPASNTVSTEKVFLPFDGDRTLSIILSKAFLLADDKKIKDTTILSQIGR